MVDSCFTIDQIGELRSIEKVLARCELSGARRDLQALIRKLQRRLGDPRMKISLALWRSGWAKFTSHVEAYEAYLATVPPIPPLQVGRRSSRYQAHFVDPRIAEENACLYAGMVTYIEVPHALPTVGQQRPQRPYWFFVDPRRVNAIDAQGQDTTWIENETGITLLEGLAMAAEIGTPERDVLCLGSVRRTRKGVQVPVLMKDGKTVRMLPLKDAVGLSNSIAPACIVPFHPETDVAHD